MQRKSVMKKYPFILTVFLFAFTILNAQPTPQSADEILKEACQQAAKEKKNVFIILHASWCVWCHRMDSSMNDPSCKKFFNDNYVIRHMVVDESKDKKNLENPGADELRNKYGGKDQGIPYWLIFDAKGNLLFDSRAKSNNANADAANNIGCPATENEVAYFIEMLKKTSKLSATQEQAIVNRFRKNEH